MNNPIVKSFFDPATFTISYIVRDPDSSAAAIIDTVLDYDPISGRTSTLSADKIIDYVKGNDLQIGWILETHAHADHLSAAPYIQSKLGGKVAIGAHIPDIQNVFAKIFNLLDLTPDGSAFDRLLEDEDRFQIGGLEARIIYTPGHTRACISYLIGDAVFVGDTLFMADYGSARCDFPGGDAGTLFDSVQKLYQLPDQTRMFLCHDYLAEGRTNHVWETTVGAQKAGNIHLSASTKRDAFIKLRNDRDAKLSMPRLIIPAIQVNIRAGKLPKPEDNGIAYLKVPLNAL